MIIKRLLGVLIIFAVIVLAGISGYMLIERWSFMDAIYMTVITIASVGYGEINPLTTNGRIFTMLLILFGSGALIYCFSICTAIFVEGELTDALRRRKMRTEISRLKDHFIVCGVGSTGQYIIDELSKTGRNFVVVDKDPARIKQLTDAHILNIEGDASHEAILEAANIRSAAGLFVSLHIDADNLLVVVTAKGLNPALKIIAKAFDEESSRKLKQVGTDSVVMPDYIGGLRMTSEMIRPHVVGFLDTMLRDKSGTIRVEEIVIQKGSRVEGKHLNETGILDINGVSVVALVDNYGKYIFNPPKERVILVNDVIIVMGIVDKIQEFKNKVT